ncbi:MAG: MBOAT family protein [Candidatus Meridianibacter frigidus]|nr:MAG: MBOAT family protein [Candidatus Eremiobacteraeota bacterium]
MFFNTWQFAMFALLVVVIYRLASPRLRAYVLLLSGLIFYASAGVGYLLLIVAVTLATYACARMLQSGKAGMRTGAFALGLLVLLGTLCYYKYARWITKSLAALFPHLHLGGFGPLIVPLAISFFTFEFIHFLSDVRSGRIERFTLKEFLTFAWFFPTMVAGPIKRYRLFSAQLGDLRMAQGPDLQAALYRIACGLFKKIAIADPVTIFVDPLFHPQLGMTAPVYAVAMVAATVKIYYDLSGYSDIAIGFAQLFGVRVPENFARPYWAPNIVEFWHRWHISLSSWVRDYVFVPLARTWRKGAPPSSTRGRSVTVVSFIVIMLIIGVWHGAGWHFAAWGLWNGVSLAAYYLWRNMVVVRVAFLRNGSLALDLASIGLTYVSFAFGLALIAAPSTADAMMVYRSFL